MIRSTWRTGLALALTAALTTPWAMASASVPAAATASASTTPAAEVAVPLLGHDISWPQCGRSLDTMPPPNQFLVIGLTRGLPLTENPCLADQVAWATLNNVPTQAYTMAAFPTPTQLASTGSQGPWSAATRAGQLSNAGYAQATFARNSLARVGFSPPVVWIDVEPRSAQPWPTATAAQRRENRLVIEGVMRGLRDAGIPYGLYSFLSGWQTITDSWFLPGVPVWATAGRLDFPDEAARLCAGPSFSGGPVYLSQWYDDTWDYDQTCGTYAFTPLTMPASTLSGSTGDFSGDWNTDVLARVRATGELRLYRGNGRGALQTAARIGTGWGIFNALDTPGDLTGDGAADVLARRADDGLLWVYPGNGRGSFLPKVRVGAGWNIYNALVGPGDFTGDQRPDLLARQTTTGELWLYRGDGRGGFAPRVRIGAGWNVFTALAAGGDLTGDGAADLIARKGSTGELWLYPGSGTGALRAPSRIGTSWNSMTSISVPGDLTGDRIPDVVARDGSGVLWLYPRTATGWLPRVRIGAGWNTVDPIF